jgi:hypothetical protein
VIGDRPSHLIYVLFFIEVGRHRVSLGGITRYPDCCWMEQVARNATMQNTGYLNGCRYLLHDRDQKFLPRFSGNTCGRRCGMHAHPSQKPKLKRLRGALGPFH